METVDEEFLKAAKDFIQRKSKESNPWFCYFNPTRMHVWTHLKPESKGVTGLGIYPDGMVETDKHVGELLKLLDDLKIDDNTVVVYTTDNGAEVLSWPDGGTTPFHGEKATNWEGSFRVPCVIRWPGVIKAGSVINEIGSNEDFIPTFAAAAGEPDIVEKVKKGHQLGNKKFRVHLDGYNLLPFFKGDVKESPRQGFVYWSDDGDFMAIRVKQWKVAFMEQEYLNGMDIWEREFTKYRAPQLYNLRADPFERGKSSILYPKWKAERMFVMIPAQALAAKWVESFREYPPRQKPASWSLSEVMESMERSAKLVGMAKDEEQSSEHRPSSSQSESERSMQH